MGTTFTDWQQVVAQERALLIDEDFTWSEEPVRRRRRRTTEESARPRRRAAEPEPEPVSRRTAVAELEPVPPARTYADATAREWESAQEPSRFDGVVQEWDAGHGESSFDSDDIASYTQALVHEDRSGSLALAGVDALQESRRTVVITGQGDERYVPASRRRRASELAFHERSTFKADRAGLWAVLLGVALLIGCIVH